MSQLELTPTNCNHPRLGIEMFITQNGSLQFNADRCDANSFTDVASMRQEEAIASSCIYILVSSVKSSLITASKCSV